MFTRTIGLQDLERLRHEREAADLAYNNALTRLDAAVRPSAGLPELAPEAHTDALAKLESLAALAPDVHPPREPFWRRWLRRLMAPAMLPWLERQAEFNRTLVDHLVRTTAGRRQERNASERMIAVLGAELGALASFQSQTGAIRAADHAIHRYEASRGVRPHAAHYRRQHRGIRRGGRRARGGGRGAARAGRFFRLAPGLAACRQARDPPVARRIPGFPQCLGAGHDGRPGSSCGHGPRRRYGRRGRGIGLRRLRGCVPGFTWGHRRAPALVSSLFRRRVGRARHRLRPRRVSRAAARARRPRPWHRHEHRDGGALRGARALGIPRGCPRSPGRAPRPHGRRDLLGPRWSSISRPTIWCG